MTNEEILALARECNAYVDRQIHFSHEELITFARRIAAINNRLFDAHAAAEQRVKEQRAVMEMALEALDEWNFDMAKSAVTALEEALK